MKFRTARDDELPTVHGVVVTPVFKLLTNAWTDLKDMVGRYGHIAEIEQAVDVPAK